MSTFSGWKMTKISTRGKYSINPLILGSFGFVSADRACQLEQRKKAGFLYRCLFDIGNCMRANLGDYAGMLWSTVYTVIYACFCMQAQHAHANEGIPLPSVSGPLPHMQGGFTLGEKRLAIFCSHGNSMTMLTLLSAELAISNYL